MLDALAAYKSRKHADITVVFDRKTGDPAEGRQLAMHQGVRVIFSAPFQEADEIIRQMVESASRPRDMLVVSSDKAGVSIYCKKLGAEIMESLQFNAYLKQSSGGRQGAAKDGEDEEQKPSSRREDIEYYLDKFTKKKK